jgi:hypothetical protein
MTVTTPADQLAKKLGWRIIRKRNGTFQLVKRDGSAEFDKPMASMVDVERALGQLRAFREQGMTVGTACGVPLYTVPPAPVRTRSPSH